MEKFNSLEKLRKKGFNTSLFITYTPELTLDDIRELGIHIGVRTGGLGLTPFLGPLSPQKALKEAGRLSREGYPVLLQEFLPGVDVILQGNVELRQDDTSFEVWYGPKQTNRAAQSSRPPDNVILRDYGSSCNWTSHFADFWNTTSETWGALHEKFGDCIVEFSYYKRPYGIHREKLILWEVR